MPSLRPLVFSVVLVALFARRVHAEDEPWKASAKELFTLYADAMTGKRYAEFLTRCESSSRSLFRELTLYHMDQVSDEELMTLLPQDEKGRAVGLKDLTEMSDAQFWTLYTGWMKKREAAAEQMIQQTRGADTKPIYKLVSINREGDNIYVITERTYAKPSPVPVPLTVLEIVYQQDRWRLKMPRELVWDAMDQARVQGINRQQELQKEAEAAAKAPADVRPPLAPPPVAVPGAPVTPAPAPAPAAPSAPATTPAPAK